MKDESSALLQLARYVNAGLTSLVTAECEVSASSQMVALSGACCITLEANRAMRVRIDLNTGRAGLFWP